MLRIAPGSFCRSIFASAVLLSVAAAIPVHAQEAGKRVALIIGNNAYTSSPLTNAVNDARAMDAALRASNFTTILLENAKLADMHAGIGEFLDKLGPDDTALLFYAGHGVQIENENFLVPVDFTPGNSLAAAKFSCMSVAQILAALNGKRARKNIVILDACRSNPVAEKYSLEAGLAQPQIQGKETYIAFSTGPGQLAADNPGGSNSWFTEALSDYVKQPALTIELNEVFNKVKKRVSDATEGRQTPWTTSNLTSSFYFHPPLNQETENDPTLAEKWFDDAKRSEQRENWADAIDKVNQVLKKKPGGTLEDAAAAKLKYLTARKDAQEEFDKGNYEAAARQYELAVKLDPFSTDAAFQGVNSYLLNERVPDAVALLKTIRTHGTSASAKKANALLQELAAVSREAGAELKAGIPQPPPIDEIFGGAHFGVPDWDAGARRLQTAPVDLNKWTKDLTLTESAPIQVAQPVIPPAAGAPVEASVAVTNAFFHVELVPTGDKRDLKIRRVANAPAVTTTNVRRPSGVPVKVTTDPPGAELAIEGDAEQRCQSPCVFNLAPSRHMIRIQLEGYRSENRAVDVKPTGGNDLAVVLEQEFGMVDFKGPQGSTPIVFDGRQLATQVPATVRVPVGKYEMRTVQDGKVLDRQEMEVTSNSRSTVTVKKQ